MPEKRTGNTHMAAPRQPRRSQALRPSGPQALGFSLVELLVVIAIIMLLAGILAPTVGKAISLGYRAKSAAAIEELSQGALHFQQEEGSFPGQKICADASSMSLALGACLWGLYDDDGNVDTSKTPKSNYSAYKADKVMDADGKNYVPCDRFPDPEAILYYPSKPANSGSTLSDAFDAGDNSGLGVGDLPESNSEGWNLKNDAVGTIYKYDTFLLIAPGIDRDYFTDDDVKNF